MSSEELDRVDRGILHILQENARDITNEEIGERVGVSQSTVRNRIQNMEENGIIRGYYPDIDYDRAGYPLHLLVLCTSLDPSTTISAKDILDVHGVIEVDELVGGDQDILVEAVAADSNQLGSIHDSLRESGLRLRQSEIFRNKHLQPFNHFGQSLTRE